MLLNFDIGGVKESLRSLIVSVYLSGYYNINYITTNPRKNEIMCVISLIQPFNHFTTMKEP